MYTFFFFLADFEANYYSPACQGLTNQTKNSSYYYSTVSSSTYSVLGNHSDAYTVTIPDSRESGGGNGNATLILEEEVCRRENSILYLLLMFGTLWLGVMLYNFNKT